MRIKITYRLVVLVVIFFTANSLFAQADSLEIHTVNGKKYYIHLVQKGESLYFIHKQYDVPIEIIIQENPSVADGLSIDEKIFIPLKKNVSEEKKTDGNFIQHEVIKKQTIYSISKLYDVEEKEIILANPEVINGIKEGQLIQVPVLNLKKKKVEEPYTFKPNYKTHQILKGETLYSLSKLYKTTVDSIKMVNDGLKQGLKLGETIYVPLKLAETNVNLNDSTSQALAVVDLNNPNFLFGNGIRKLLKDSVIVIRKHEYLIGVLLPFYLDENDEIAEKRSILEEKKIYSKSKTSVEFYSGLRLALDSISSDSCNFKLVVYDTKGNDSLRIKNLLLKPEMKEMDLIFGPLYYDNFAKVSRFAKEHNIPIVSPIKQSNKILLGNEFVFKVIPSKSTSIKQICSLVVDSFKTQNLLALSHSKSKERSLVDLYVESYNNLLLNIEDTLVYSGIKVLEINTSISDVVDNLQMNKNNVIFVPSLDQAFVSSLFSYLVSTLNRKGYQDCKITIIGMEEWIKFKSIDLEYFQKLNIHYCSSRYIDETDSLGTNFIKNYIKQTDTYPSNNVLLGFDLAYFFGNNFINEGTVFSTNAIKNYTGISIDLGFFKTGIESGFENTNTHILRFDDHILKKLY